MSQITDEAYQKMQSFLEQSFAVLWVEKYPHLDLVVQVPFALSPRGKVRASKLRADFAYGHQVQFVKNKPFLLLPPAVLIEVDGGVHRYKWDEDVQKEAIARQLGFKFHRVYEKTMELVIDAIAADILELQREEQLRTALSKQCPQQKVFDHVQKSKESRRTGGETN